MPAAVGQGSFWTGMVEYMQAGRTPSTGVLDDIESQLARPSRVRTLIGDGAADRRGRSSGPIRRRA